MPSRLPDPHTKLAVAIGGPLWVVFGPYYFPFEARRQAEILEEELTAEGLIWKLRAWDACDRNVVATVDAP